MHFVFGDCVLDPDRRELTRRSEVVSAGPKVFDLLVHLVRNRERVVSKDDLLQAVWDGRIVSESTLTSHINAVREAIGDSGEEQRLIRTLARKGFRFIGAVEEIQSSDDVKSPPKCARAWPPRVRATASSLPSSTARRARRAPSEISCVRSVIQPLTLRQKWHQAAIA